MPGRRITVEQRVEIAERREAGESYAALAKAFGCSHSNVRWICLMLGADRPGAKPLSTIAPGPSTMRRGDFVVRRFTAEDDAWLLVLEAEGKNPSEIGRALGRPPNSIRGRLATLARHDARSEAA